MATLQWFIDSVHDRVVLETKHIVCGSKERSKQNQRRGPESGESIAAEFDGLAYRGIDIFIALDGEGQPSIFLLRPLVLRQEF